MKKELPPPIFGNIPGTWAYSTVCERLPDIALRVIQENQYAENINENLTQLVEEIAQRSIRYLEDRYAPDHEDWSACIQPYLNLGWQDVPWFFAEHYFYRRIMEAVDYFHLGQDPFRYQKNQGLQTSKKAILQLSQFLSERRDRQASAQETLKEGIYFSLWGNQADLSLWPADSDFSPQHTSQQSLQDHLLANHIEPIIRLLCEGNQPLPRVDLMLDNAGLELISDLALVDILLSNDLVEQVILQAKAHPTFVSDVIREDISETIGFLHEQAEAPIQSFGARLTQYTNSGRLRITSNFFWNSPLPMWEIPDDLKTEWQGSSLVISKGDANYRRLVGDREWEMTTPFHEVVDFLPVSLAALRALKAELAVGLEASQIREVGKADPNWMVNGRWGVIHFADGVTPGNTE